MPDEDHGADLYHVDNQGEKHWHEVEVSPVSWDNDTGEYLYPHTSIPERKLRLVTDYGYNHLYHWLIRQDCGVALVTNMRTRMVDKYCYHVPNKLVKKGEYFYRPPLRLCKWVNLKED